MAKRAAWLYAILYILLLPAIVGVAKGAIAEHLPNSAWRMPTVIAGSLGAWAGLCWVAWKISRAVGASLPDISFRGYFVVRGNASRIVQASLIVLGGVLLLDALLRFVPPVPATSTSEALQEAAMSAGGLVLASTVLVTVIGVAVLEEVIVRGILLQFFLAAAYSRWIAVLATSLLWALAHKTALSVLFVCGMLYAWSALYARSLWPPILGHSASNLLFWLHGEG